MEAKVDVRKLQILNDRINQTIDALNQVRFSVHGLGHTGVPTKMMNPFGIMAQGFGFPTYPPFYGIPPVPPTPAFPPIPGLFGLQHTPYTPYTPFVNPLFNVPTPYTAPVVNPLVPTQGITPNWGIPQTPWFGGGLLHTPVDPFELKLLEGKLLDPYRILQTFPYISY